MIEKKFDKKIDPGLLAEIRKEVTDDYILQKKNASVD